MTKPALKPTDLLAVIKQERLVVSPELHAWIKETAAMEGIEMGELTKLLIEYALPRLESVAVNSVATWREE